jgi:hypothetical protein
MIRVTGRRLVLSVAFAVSVVGSLGAQGTEGDFEMRDFRFTDGSTLPSSASTTPRSAIRERTWAASYAMRCSFSTAPPAMAAGSSPATLAASCSRPANRWTRHALHHPA